MSAFLTTPAPHDEAAGFISGKATVSRNVWQGLLPELRARAFAVAGIESASVLQNLRDTVAKLPQGGDWNALKKDLVAQLSPFLVGADADPDERDRQINGANRRAELLLRTHGFQAYQAAAYRVMDEERETFPFWQYHTMGDGRVRPAHAALDKVTLPADSPFWKLHFPPWDFGCRCQVVPLSEEDAREIEAADSGKPMEDRSFFSGVAQTVLEQQNRLLRPTGTMDVTPPSMKAGAGTVPWQWHPGDLRLSASALRARYDAPTWAAFETWARQTPLAVGETETVWDRFIGAPATPSPAPALPPPPPLPAVVAKPVPRSVAAMETDLNAAAAADPTQRRRLMHETLALDPSLRSSIAYTTPADELGLSLGFEFVRQITSSGQLAGAPVQILKRFARARADVFGAWINGRQMNARTVAHELGHIIEARTPAILAKSEAFLAARTVGDKPRWLGRGYGRDEVTLDDQWVAKGGSAYSGKVYRRKSNGATYATEILSMGIERLWVDPVGFWAQDREYFTFVVNTLRGF